MISVEINILRSISVEVSVAAEVQTTGGQVTVTDQNGDVIQSIAAPGNIDVIVFDGFSDEEPYTPGNYTLIDE